MDGKSRRGDIKGGGFLLKAGQGHTHQRWRRGTGSRITGDQVSRVGVLAELTWQNSCSHWAGQAKDRAGRGKGGPEVMAQLEEPD